MQTNHDESLRYGKQGDRFLHISEVSSGASCGCVCIECGEPLVAKKGPVLTHHFAHVADTNCNPTPESLTHRYAKGLVARALSGIEPAFGVQEEVKGLAAWARSPATVFQADKAEVEPQRFEGFVPDVLLEKGSRKLAVEIHFRHPVPPQKVALLEQNYTHAVEVDLSDLPVDASPDELKVALGEVRRWSWLNNRSSLFGELKAQLTTCSSLYIPKIKAIAERKVPTCSSPQVPHNKIKEAEEKVVAMAQWCAQPSASRRPYPELSPAEKLALHCAYIGIRPLELPLHLMQTVRGQLLLGHIHCVYWQTWFFAKFCIGSKPIELKSVERAARAMFCDLRMPRKTLQSENGFSQVGELFYELLLQLAMQGLVTQHKGERAWLHTFSPKVQTKEEARSLLIGGGHTSNSSDSQLR